jgi:hypothetical protein
MGFAGATFSTNVYAPNLVNSVNGITGSVNLVAGTGTNPDTIRKKFNNY